MAGAKGRARAVLVICNGGFEGMRHELSGDETIIGRNPTTDITLLDETTGIYTLEDLQSTNGSKVNGKRVRSAELAPGDEIEIGHTNFKLLLNDS